MSVLFSRKWSIPSKYTFDVKPIGEFVSKYLSKSKVSVDPFCGNKQWFTHCNDLGSGGVDAEIFLNQLETDKVVADLVIFDPPYSPRQISECYKSVGLEVGMKETQNSLLYKRVRNAIPPICTEDAIVLSFGWNSVGMGKKHGFDQIEILLVCHGSAHNDTICLAERRNSKTYREMSPL